MSNLEKDITSKFKKLQGRGVPRYRIEGKVTNILGEWDERTQAIKETILDEVDKISEEVGLTGHQKGSETKRAKKRVNWDVGGLALLTMHRDILKYAVAIIDDDLWNKHREFFERVKTYRNTKFPKLKLMNPKTFKEWVKTKHKEMEEITSNF